MTRRRRDRRLAAAALGVWLVAAAPLGAAAQPPTDPKFSFGSKEEAAELDKAAQVEWKVAAQGGLILTTGNSRVTTFAAGLNASRKANRNKFSLEAGTAYARSRILLPVDRNGNGTIEPGELSRPSQTTTRSWLVKGRYDRYLTAANAVYGALGLSADEPAGKELVASGQVGYSRQVYRDAVHLLVAEAGYDFAFEDQISGDGVSIHSMRGFVGYTGKLSKDTGLDASVEALSNVNHLDSPGGEISSFEDNRVNGKLSLTTVLFLNISFRVAFEARYDHAPAPRPPVSLPYAEGFAPLADELDTRTEASLIVNFL